ncbi:MAG TPA: hypothetical protein ENK10_04680 [Acidobacteria bacterium]|nr:hypothetical protein [Acidobacteriota bacterium]
MRSFMRLTVVLICGALIPLQLAEAREWQNWHVDVQTPAGEPVCEFSEITTSDGQKPWRSRVLFEDAEGALLVIRDVHDESAPPSTISIESVASGEKLVFSIDSAATTVTMHFGEQSVQFADDESAFADPTVHQQVANLLEGASAPFMGALERLSLTGQKYVSRLRLVAELLAKLVFYDNPDPGGQEAVRARTQIQRDFDPQATPPSDFETRFGSHYYQ